MPTPSLPSLGFTPPNYPSLTAKPQLPIEQKYADNTLRTPMESGYEITRARNSRTRREWTVHYTAMSAADWATLETFVMTTVNMGAGIFVWTHPADSTTHNVRFSVAPATATLWLRQAVGYSVQFTLREV